MNGLSLNVWFLAENIFFPFQLRERLNTGSEIYQTFVATSSVIHVSKEHMEGMEAFIVGNKGPESFYHAQRQVYQQLDEDHYPSFLISEQYQKLMDSKGGHRHEGLSEQMLEEKGLNVEVSTVCFCSSKLLQILSGSARIHIFNDNPRTYFAPGSCWVTHARVNRCWKRRDSTLKLTEDSQ